MEDFLAAAAAAAEAAAGRNSGTYLQKALGRFGEECVKSLLFCYRVC